MEPERFPIHPLFDESSFFRLATRESTWADHGEHTIRSFFAGLAREELHRAWQTGQPLETQPWGFAGVPDEEIGEFLSHNAVVAQPVRRPVRTREGPSDTYIPPPALLIFNLDPGKEGATPPPTPVRSEGLFTGVGDRLYGQPARQFAVEISGLPKERRCLLIILPDHRVHRLAEALGRPAPTPTRAGEAEAVEIVHAAIRPESLSNHPETPDAMKRAFQISGVLARSPVIEGKTGDGKFRRVVDLGRECPTLPPWSWVVLCIGPLAPGAADIAP